MNGISLKKIMGGMVLMAGILSFLTGCFGQDGGEKGGSTVKQDSNAKKEITSEDLVSFDCYFSTVSMVIDDVPAGQYDLKAELDGESGKVRGSYCFTENMGSFKTLTFDFEADKTFMQSVQKIVKDSKIEAINGTYHKVEGIPPEFGYSLKAVYASEEKISCSDNQTCEFGNESVKAFYELFSKASGYEEFYNTDELLSVYYSVYEQNKYYLYAWLAKLPDGTYSLKVSEKTEDGERKEIEKEADKALMERIGDIYKTNNLSTIQTFPRREGDVSYILRLKFGKEEATVTSDTNISDEQYAALIGIKDILLGAAG